MHGDRYQIALIALGVAVTGLLGYFFYQEMFPEYRIYQDDYVALEEFRSSYTHEPPPAFSLGVKQIVFEREDKGPASVDRCVSCHVAMQLPHFSPTKIAYDGNGKMIRNEEGFPIQIKNENYIWEKLDLKIASLIDPKVIEQLHQQGESAEVKSREAEARHLSSLKATDVGDQRYDVTKVLVMHPLIGKETRPFEFHPLDDYGCTACHSGNGRGLTTEKAHGPVFDGQYEIEHEGSTPEFTERDRVNDPTFSTVFNHKPSDSLLFQTTPILVGNLIQSSCVQCHAQDSKTLPSHVEETKNSFSKMANDPFSVSSMKSDLDKLTTNFHRGQDLFLSQACYACHKISGRSRGGVGPELTYAGHTYPWFLKESIVWPQADLRTSTMPNFKLDHVELEDLMTYLLAQKGPTKAISPMEYKIDIQKWEAGKKSPWENSISPSDIHNLRNSMIIYATQGCAACHRLEGFDSNVGFSIEKTAKLAPENLYHEHQWFKNLFPEEIRGSAIIKTLESHAEEIDQHLSGDVRNNGILEAIDAQSPGTIESFYSNFRFAERAKDALHDSIGSKESAQQEKKLWKKRVHQVLMMYIQEYGLGRLIGPRLNWSGIYRSDEWLMEHFHNPSSRSPRSIMPVMPFDDSKFMALTYMLDSLGRRNRDTLHSIWKQQGFAPELAYKILCSQCHGDYLQGNGPVSNWIYPVPKNLRNTEFLRNLTKEKAIDSIMHGVKGTPMAPWGETVQDKEGYDGVPILTHAEIQKLVDWLYLPLAGANVIKGIEDVPKYHYTTKNIINELHREKGLTLSDDQLFDKKLNPIESGDKDLYYIKKDHYSEENIESGKKFFNVNCSHCHGADADGSGIRASIMQEAKPRMLTNIDWLNNADDLKLLRSIKYGVLGTAMTPWGDFTSSLQRLQLVMYIRSLSFEKERRTALAETLYQVFTHMDLQVEEARIVEYSTLDKVQKQYDANQKERHQTTESDQKALALYAEQLKLKSEITILKTRDQIFIDMKNLINQEEAVYATIGNAFLSNYVEDALWNDFLNLIALNANRFTYENKKITLNENNIDNLKRDELSNKIAIVFDKKISQLNDDKLAIQGKLPSQGRSNELHAIEMEIANEQKLKALFLSALKQAELLRSQEVDKLAWINSR